MNKTKINITEKWQNMMPILNEKQRRYYAAYETQAYGYGGISLFAEATNISRETIHQGINEINSGNILGGERVRRPGGGRTKVEEKEPKIINIIESEANPKTDKRVIVKWTSNSIEHIAQAISQRGFEISTSATRRILIDLGYALKANKKDIEGNKDHPDRNAQFNHINMTCLKMQIQNFPILSIDAKKTEKIGNMKNNGKEWMPKGQNTKVNVYDFGEKDSNGKVLKAIPYGVYDVLKKQGFVNVGIDSNTAEFAVHSLLVWWNTDGKKIYPNSTEILLLADCGSSNGYKNKLWKYNLQQFANKTRLTVNVCHYPPGTSKWNYIEHQMFSFININWRAKPLTAHEVILELIRNTTTKTGLKIKAVLDENTYKTGKKITDEQLKSLNIVGNEFHPEWNYKMIPKLE
jgi:transposase